MKIKFFPKLVFLFAISFSISTNAQRNFYHRIDLGSSNLYTFVISNIVTGYANYFSHDILFDNSYAYTFYKGVYCDQNIKTKAFSPIGITARDLFNDAFAGVKLGYQSDNMGGFNWGIYASTHYKINQVKATFLSEDYSNECFQYIKPGLGLMFTFGSVENTTKVQLEAVVRYDIPIGYNGYFGNRRDALNNGVSSRFVIKVAGYKWFSVGAYTELNYYDLYKFKNVTGKSNFKMYNIGLTFTITPKRGEDIYD